MAYKKVYLKPGKEESLKRFHPWVFSGAIQRIEGEPEEGEIVDVYTSKKEFIACGHFQIGSIAVRVLSFRKVRLIMNFGSINWKWHTICAAVWVWPVILQTILTVWFMAKETTCRA
mgnify:FL=1